MKKILWVGDAGCPSGFGVATHEILASVCKEYDVTVLAMNFRGDPTGYPEFLRGRLWAAAPGGDSLGVGRLVWMCDMVKPDLIVLQNDGWHVPLYVQQLRTKKSNGEYAFPEHAGIPIVAVVAVDGKNFQGAWLGGVAHAIFWTQFGLDEAHEGGYVGPASVIPLGVDLDAYRPIDRYEARLRRGLPRSMDDAFIVGNVNRNQPRKRWDLTVKYFAEWIKSRGIRDAWLYLHTAPTGDSGPDVEQLARYYSVIDRLALMKPPIFYGVSEQEMRDTYNCFDVQISTTQGEGFGLTTLEGMACGVPQIVPDWAALGEWAKRGAWMVPCTSTGINPVAPGLNVVGGVPDEAGFVKALNKLYVDKRAREQNAQAALECAQQSCYHWADVGRRYVEVIGGVLGNKEAWRDLGRPQEATA